MNEIEDAVCCQRDRDNGLQLKARECFRSVRQDRTGKRENDRTDKRESNRTNQRREIAPFYDSSEIS